MNRKTIVKYFIIIYLICFTLVFMFKYFSDQLAIEESMKIAALQSLLFSLVLTVIAIISPTSKFRKK